MDGRTLHAQPAWVVTAPPNFAPGLATGWRTLHDVLEDTWVTAGMLPSDPSVSFQRHILPLFVRLARLQWVNAGILRDNGWKSPHDLAGPGFLAKLADASAPNRRSARPGPTSSATSSMATPSRAACRPSSATPSPSRPPMRANGSA